MKEKIKLNLIPYFNSKKFLITISCSDGRYKIIKIIFHTANGSIFITFPYFRYSQGIVSLATLPGDVKEPANVSLEPGGKVVSRLVKYSHHPNGRTLFSQDGKILSKIKKMSARLDSNPGHIFTIQIQDLKGFEGLEGEPKDDSQTEKQKILNFHFQHSLPEAIKLTARWNTKNYISKNYMPPFTNPITAISRKDGSRKTAFLISPTKDIPTYHSAMMLTCESVPKLTNEPGSHLTFAGGFDTRETIAKYNGDIKFLSLIYPIVDFEEMKKKIGDIDFNPTRP